MFNNINIYWINLNRAENRKERMIKQFNDFNLKHTRIEAIDGNDIQLEEIKKTYKVNEKLNKYEVACTLSHIKAIETAYNNKLEHVLILEDDCCFDYIKFQTLPIEEVIHKLLLINGECVQLANISNVNFIKKVINNPDFLTPNVTAGAMAYLITNKGMKKVLDKFYNNKKFEVSETTIFNNLNNYICKPYFTYYFYKQNKSFIRANNKSAHTCQTLSKIEWDKYYNIN